MRLDPHDVRTGVAGSGVDTVCGVAGGEWSTAGSVAGAPDGGAAGCEWCDLPPTAGASAEGVVCSTIFATGPRPASDGRTCASSTRDARWILNWYLGVAASYAAPLGPNSTRHVWGPTMPSTSSPLRPWKTRTARSVRGPNSPSGVCPSAVWT